MKNGKKPPPINRLCYQKNDLIIKEGDYGISIYEIIDGKVGIFCQSGEVVTNLATLGPGEIFGEMIFLNGLTEPRTASARALTDSVVDAWHLDKMAMEYGRMPPILKYLSGQTLKRLIMMNRMLAGLNAKRREKARKEAERLSAGNKRKFYRKNLHLPCIYSPVKAADILLKGHIRNVSRSGCRLDINVINLDRFSHLPGDILIINTALTPEQKVELTSEIVSIKKSDDDQIYIGLRFVRLSEDAKKKLGFFLLPYAGGN